MVAIYGVKIECEKIDVRKYKGEELLRVRMEKIISKILN